MTPPQQISTSKLKIMWYLYGPTPQNPYFGQRLSPTKITKIDRGYYTNSYRPRSLSSRSSTRPDFGSFFDVNRRYRNYSSCSPMSVNARPVTKHKKILRTSERTAKSSDHQNCTDSEPDVFESPQPVLPVMRHSYVGDKSPRKNLIRRSASCMFVGLKEKEKHDDQHESKKAEERTAQRMTRLRKFLSKFFRQKNRN